MISGIQWRCPFCQRHATITSADYAIGEIGLRGGGPSGNKVVKAVMKTCPNPECRKYALEAWLFQGMDGPGVIRHSSSVNASHYWALIPESSAVPFPAFVPQAIREDYEEACKIVSRSPKAAATLARRCLQGMIRDVWKVKKKNLAAAIDAIKSKVEPDAWAAIQGVRTIGNIGAHMEKDVDLIIAVDVGEAEALLRLIEALIEDWYIKPRQRKALFDKVAAVAKEKASQRAAARQPQQDPDTSASVPMPPDEVVVPLASTAASDPRDK